MSKAGKGVGFGGLAINATKVLLVNFFPTVRSIDFIVDTGCSTTVIRVSDDEYVAIKEFEFFGSGATVTSNTVKGKVCSNVTLRLGGVDFKSSVMFMTHSGCHFDESDNQRNKPKICRIICLV